MKVSVVVVNWNGKEFLEKCLKSVVEASNAAKYESSVIVVDMTAKMGA